ncbi:MAG: hypothetical protein KJ622_05510 [Alphaproteobacteria bacterium]|nr:hypothetical protein [Alphaproteobacteria bacterium]
MTKSIEEYVEDDFIKRSRDSQKEKLEREYELNIQRAVEAKDDADRTRFKSFAVNARRGLTALADSNS